MLRRSTPSKISKNWWIVYASREESYDRESIVDSNSGSTEQSELILFQTRRNFYDPETESSSGATHVPSQPSTLPSPKTMPCRECGLPHDTRNGMGTSGNVFQRLPAREEQTSTFLNNSKNFSNKVGPDTEGKTKKQGSEMTREPKHEISDIGIASGKISWLHGISKLERQIQNWSMFEISRSSFHNALDQKKLRSRNQFTILWHRNRLPGEKISPTTICLMRWLRLYWKGFSTSMFTSAKE